MKCNAKEQETCDVEKRGCTGCKYNEKTADEVFEELGYKKVKDNEEMCVYETTFPYDLDFKRMRFMKEHQRIDLNGNMIYTTLYLDELQAINKKCLEMRVDIMAGVICKQPNGKYCRYSSIVETMTHINMTFENYVKVIMERSGYQEWKAREEAEDVFTNYLYPYEKCEITLLNETKKSREELIEKMNAINGKFEER